MTRSFKPTGLATLREIGDVILLPKKGKMANLDDKVLILNDVAAFLWKRLESGCPENLLVEAVVATFDTASEVAATDVRYYIDTLEYLGLIQPRKVGAKEATMPEIAPNQKKLYRTPKIYAYDLVTNEEVAFGPHIRGRTFIQRAVVKGWHGGCC